MSRPDPRTSNDFVEEEEEHEEEGKSRVTQTIANFSRRSVAEIG